MSRAPRPPSVKRQTLNTNKGELVKASAASERPRLDEDAAIARRRVQALDLAVAGASYRQIAERLDVSLGTAFNDVQAELGALRAEAAEKAEDYRALLIRRLDRWVLALSPKAARGDEKAIRVMVSIEDRRAKLLGLDAPTRIAPTTPDGEPYQQITRIIVDHRVRD